MNTNATMTAAERVKMKKSAEYQCPKCSSVIPWAERMQFVDDTKFDSIMVCIECFDRMAADAYTARTTATK